MSPFFLSTVLALFIQASLSQVIGNCGCNQPFGNYGGYGLGPLNPGPAFVSPAAPCQQYGGVGAGNVGVTGDVGASGSTAVVGSVPVLGAVDFSGVVPACGSVAIAGQCGCGCN